MKSGWIAVLLLSGLVVACASPERKPVGGEKDAQGCLVAAGYSWSKVQHACIRVFESGVRVADAGNTRPELASFVVFGREGERAELFLPEEKESVVLERNGPVWENGRFRLYLDKAEWVLDRRNGR